MNPTLRQLAAFAQVARFRSFARAAELLGMSQPALSQVIARAEETLGVKLFQRTTRAVRLTAEGEFFLPHAEAILAHVAGSVEALKAQARQHQAGITIGTLPSLVAGLLAEIMHSYRARHPDSQVTVIDGTAEVLYAGIASGQIDMAVGSRLADRPDISFQPLFDEAFALVLRRDHGLARQERITWTQALHEDFIAYPMGSSGRATIENALQRAGLALKPVMTFAQSTSTLGMVEAGIGVAALPSAACPAPDHRTLTSRPLIDPIVTRQIGFLHLAARPPTTAMLAMQAVIRDVLGARRAG